MKCPSCKSEAKTLSWGDSRSYCDLCHREAKIVWRDSYLVLCLTRNSEYFIFDLPFEVDLTTIIREFMNDGKLPELRRID